MLQASQPTGSAAARGRDAASPFEMPAEGWKEVLLRTWLSIGVQKGPPIGVQKGPPSSSGVTGLAGVLFALVAAEGGRSPTGGATSAKRLLPVVPGVSCGA